MLSVISRNRTIPMAVVTWTSGSSVLVEDDLVNDFRALIALY